MNLAIFHQCYKEKTATSFAVSSFRRHNTDCIYYLVSDGGDDFSDIAKQNNVEWCYENNVTMAMMNSEVALKVINRIKKYFEISSCKYLMLMEDDIWCRGKIDFDFEFNAIGANSINNIYHPDALSYISKKYGVDIKNNYFNLCGGSILNRDIFFYNFDIIEKFLFEDHDYIRKISKYENSGFEYGGWDSTLNMLYIICNKEVGINPEITETWRDADWRTNNKKIVHWFKSFYINGNEYSRYYL